MEVKKRNEMTRIDESDLQVEDILAAMHKKINYFFENKIPVHISAKNGRFYNGMIKSVSEDHLILNDAVLAEIPIFFIEIREILKLKPKEN